MVAWKGGIRITLLMEARYLRNTYRGWELVTKDSWRKFIWNYTLQRRYKGESYTIGSLYINSTYFCDTLEDRVRNIPTEGKVGETAIPRGKYKIILNYSPKFKRHLPRLVRCALFWGDILNSSGEYRRGFRRVYPWLKVKRAKVINSTKYEIELVRLISDARARGKA